MSLNRAVVSVASLLGLSAAAAQQPAQTQRTNQPPTASEAFHLRGECNALGKTLLEEKLWALRNEEVKSQISHYNPLSNYCYVMVTVQTQSFKNHALYDGQSLEMLAIAEIATKFDWVFKGRSFTGKQPSTIPKNWGPGGYDNVCAYIDKMMEETNHCADLDLWFMMQKIAGRKPLCDLEQCR